MTTITFGDLSFELRHSAKRRTIGITVERDGQLILASPPEVPMETLEKVVRDKRLWIYSKLLKKESLNPPTAVKEYVSGEGFYYLGRSYRLKLVDGVNRQPPLRLYQSRFELQREAQARGREEFIRWYCDSEALLRSADRLRSILDTQIAALVKRIGASPRSVQVRELGYRWGSCGHKGDLYFHWRVAMLPRTMIEYVVVHELVHLIEPHHTTGFWDRVEWVVSDWCDRKQWLAENGASYDL
jgi:predicted metal-dependent hydrolase